MFCIDSVDIHSIECIRDPCLVSTVLTYIVFDGMVEKPSVSAFCCDIGQIDRFSIIELFPLSSCQVIILIARMTFNCFHQLFDELCVL